jgi:hypothetical protein
VANGAYIQHDIRRDRWHGHGRTHVTVLVRDCGNMWRRFSVGNAADVRVKPEEERPSRHLTTRSHRFLLPCLHCLSFVQNLFTSDELSVHQHKQRMSEQKESKISKE